jgi:hypothetical protein
VEDWGRARAAEAVAAEQAGAAARTVAEVYGTPANLPAAEAEEEPGRDLEVVLAVTEEPEGLAAERAAQVSEVVAERVRAVRPNLESG